MRQENSGRKQWTFISSLSEIRISPNPAEQSKGTLLGLGTDTDHVSIYRSILEGMACNVRMIVEGMMQYPEFPTLSRIHCFGGESQNPLLLKIKASVLNRRWSALISPSR